MTFRHIYHKLLVLFSLAITLSVLLVLALTVWLQTHLIRDEWRNSLQAQASLVANNSQAAIEFQDPREGRRLLRSLAEKEWLIEHDNLEQQFIDTITCLSGRQREKKLEQLLELARTRNLDDSEKQQLNHLLAQKHRKLPVTGQQ